MKRRLRIQGASGRVNTMPFSSLLLLVALSALVLLLVVPQSSSVANNDENHSYGNAATVASYFPMDDGGLQYDDTGKGGVSLDSSQAEEDAMAMNRIQKEEAHNEARNGQSDHLLRGTVVDKGEHHGGSSTSSLSLSSSAIPVYSHFMRLLERANHELSREGMQRRRAKRRSSSRHKRRTEGEYDGITNDYDDEEEGEERAWPLFTRRPDDQTPRSIFYTYKMKAGDAAATTNRKMKEDIHGEEELEEELSIEVAYEDVYDTLLFLFATFFLGKAASLIGMPSLVGEICAGFLIGPPLAHFVPFPEALVLFGEIGLILLLLEAGVEIDVAQLKETGKRSVAIAVTGSMLPLGIGTGLGVAAGQSVRSAIATGASFSPTSLGVASNALDAGNVLNTPVGQLIVAACVVDDIIGLIILGMLEVLVNEDAEIYEYFIPLISGFGYLIVLGWSAITWIPRVIEQKILPRFREEHQELVAFSLMIILLMLYLPMMYYSRASYLTGAFLAGLAFSQIHSVHATFVYQTKNLMKWLLRIFFAASIGFQIPIRKFFTGEVLKWGIIFYICVLAKLPLGLFVPHFQATTPKDFPFKPSTRDALITGLAMTCRGEFSFIIAAFALGEELFDPQKYSSVVFAVLLSAITSPFILLWTIKHYNNLSKQYLVKSHPCGEDGVSKDGMMPLYLVIQVRTGLQAGLQETLESCAGKLGLFIIDHRSWHPRGLDAIVVTEMYVQDTTTRISVPRIGDFKANHTKKSTEVDIKSEAVGDKSVAEGDRSVAEGDKSVAEGDKSVAEGDRSEAEGDKNEAEGDRGAGENGTSEMSGVKEKRKRRHIESNIESMLNVRFSRRDSDKGGDDLGLATQSVSEEGKIESRCEEIKAMMLDRIGSPTARVQVMQWKPHVFQTLAKSTFEGKTERVLSFRCLPPEEQERIAAEAEAALSKKQAIDSRVDERPIARNIRSKSGPIEKATLGELQEAGSFHENQGAADISVSQVSDLDGEQSDTAPAVGPPSYPTGVRRRHRMMSVPYTASRGLWDEDEEARKATLQGVLVPKTQYDLASGTAYGISRRRKVPSTLQGIAEEVPTVEERLGGFVRHEM